MNPADITISGPRHSASLLFGDCLERMKLMESNSVDAIVTDPPAGIGFMGKSWDSFDSGRSKGLRNSDRCLNSSGLSDGGNRLETPTIGGHSVNPTCRKCGNRQRTWKTGPPACVCDIPEMNQGRSAFVARDAFVEFLRIRMAEAYRIAKPGAYALVWAIPRTSHWTATALEDSGWMIRDRVSNFLPIAPIVDEFLASLDDEQAKMFGMILESENVSRVAHIFSTGFPKSRSCLKTSCEDWWLAYKPAKFVAPLQIDDCRIGTEIIQSRLTSLVPCSGNKIGDSCGWGNRPGIGIVENKGRWPANSVFSHSSECRQIGTHLVKADAREGGEGSRPGGFGNVGSVNGDGKPAGKLYGDKNGMEEIESWECADGCPAKLINSQSDSGGASRFFYTPKASRDDRGPGNKHPTVKSTDLCKFLIKLISKPGNTIFDPFMGSGSTGRAAMIEDRNFIGIENHAPYFPMAIDRVKSGVDFRLILDRLAPTEPAPTANPQPPPPVVDGPDFDSI